ncbi:MAG TPA: sigma-70 family RNA polymerase sigma factor [Phycisphaerales bacterium]|nr:sigma-70 family RNA polymerase sigma factor [Phycisphaerales bacterium]
MPPSMATLASPMPPLSQQSPEELAVRAQCGGGPAMSCFGELVTRFEVRLFNFLLRRTRSRSDAEELTQEAFARAWERIASYDPSWKFSTWLYTIASRLAVSKHRKLSREQVWESFDRPAAQGVDGLEAADDRRLGRKLWSLAERTLSPDQQTALWLRYAEDMSIGEIAKVMGKSQVGVRVSLFRARQTLAKGASAEGWMPVIEVNNISADEDFAGVEAAGGRA